MAVFVSISGTLCFYFLHVALTLILFFVFFFFNDTATTEIYTLSLHDALPISFYDAHRAGLFCAKCREPGMRSEEHTSELQSRRDLVCRLLLEKKKINKTNSISIFVFLSLVKLIAFFLFMRCTLCRSLLQVALN